MEDAPPKPGPPPPRGPGRPRDVRADEAIARAVAELLAEVGYGALTIEGVAARAAVAKTTIYRRFSSADAVEPAPAGGDLKARMVAEALAVRARSRLASVDTGALRSDLLEHMGAISQALAAPVGRAVAGLVVGARRMPELAEALRRGFVATRRAEVGELLARAAGRGELQPGLDPELAIDLVVSPLWYRALVWGESVDGERLAALVDSLLPALQRPPAAAP